MLGFTSFGFEILYNTKICYVWRLVEKFLMIFLSHSRKKLLSLFQNIATDI